MSDYAYRGMLKRALSATSAWRTAAIIGFTILVFLAIAMVRMQTSQTVVLVPYGMASANAKAAVRSGDEADNNYLRILAKADAQTLLNWTPETVNQQYNLFMTRLDPKAYAQYADDLSTKAERFAEGVISQSFYVQSIRRIPDLPPLDNSEIKARIRNPKDRLTPGDRYAIEVTGQVIRREGDTELVNTVNHYVFYYTPTPTGIFAINEIATRKEKYEEVAL